MKTKQSVVEANTEDSSTANAVGEPAAEDGFLLPLTQGELVQRLKSERVEEMLKAMPGWHPAQGGKAINRAKVFPTPEVARLYSTFVTGYAGALGLPVVVNLAGAQVVVVLHAPRVRGRAGQLTEGVLELARRLG